MRRPGFAVIVFLAVIVTVILISWPPQVVERLARLVVPDGGAASQGTDASASKTATPGYRNKGPQGGKDRTVAVMAVQAEAGSMPNTRRTIGYVRPLASAELATEAAGIVASVNAKDGAEVRTGDLLVQLDDRTAKATVAKDRAALARDTATLDDARLNLQRTRKLAISGAATQQALDDAQSTVESAGATVAIDQANVDADQVVLDKTGIRAPFDGRLGAFDVSVGSLAQPSTPIVSIVQTRPVYAEFSFSETDLSLLRSSEADDRLHVEVVPSLAPAGTPAIEGPVVFIDNQVDQASATVRLRALLPNEDATLWPNQSIDVTVEAGSQDNLVLVPNVAVQPRQDGSIVFVVKPDSTIEVRKVEVALRSQTQAGLSAGLAAGETVVVEGQADLAEGTAVRVSTSEDGALRSDGAGTAETKGSAPADEAAASNGGRS